MGARGQGLWIGWCGRKIAWFGSSGKAEPWQGGAERGERRVRAWGKMDLGPVGAGGESPEAVRGGMEGAGHWLAQLSESPAAPSGEQEESVGLAIPGGGLLALPPTRPQPVSSPGRWWELLLLPTLPTPNVLSFPRTSARSSDAPAISPVQL